MTTQIWYNASGTAGLIELARMLATGRSPLATPEIVLVAYANEEPPFFASDEMGSAVHAASVAGRDVRMICFEMIGYYTAEQPWSSWTLRVLFPTHGDFIAVAGGWRDRALTREVKRALAGAGIAGGVVVGKTDKQAGEPTDRPVKIEDLGATVYKALGINFDKEYHANGRPVRIVKDGAPVKEVFA